MKSISMNFARTLTVGVWSIASMALAGQGKAASPACYEGGAQGKVVSTAKTQEECQKLGEKFVWTEAAPVEHKAHAGKGKGKTKQQAKAESKPAVTEKAVETAPAAQPVATPAAATPAPATEAPKK